MLGVETVCRLSKAVSVAPARGIIAWNQTGITGGIGAAVAAGKLLGLDARGLCSAIGIAASQASGLRVMHGSMCMSLMPAQAAQNGLRAALLAAGGFTSSEHSIEGTHGFASVFAEHPDLLALARGLGESFEILSNTYKPYPCGIVIHPIIEACLRLKTDRNLDHRAVDRVRIRANPKALALTDRRHPRDSLDAQVSLYHWAAVSIVHGAARIAEGSEDRIRDPAVAALRDRIDACSDPSVLPDSAEVSVLLQDGEIVSQNVEHCIGSVAKPMTDRELERKFRDLAEGVIGLRKTETLLESCWQLDTLEDAGAIASAAA